MNQLNEFDSVWLIDFEFSPLPGEHVVVVCMVAREFFSGQTIRIPQGQFPKSPPFDTSERTLVVAYYAPAEWSCFLQLGWPLPARSLDLFVEFRQLTNGRVPKANNKLLGALVYHGLSAMDATEKRDMQELAIRGGNYTAREMGDLLDYCEEDVNALVRLLPAMLPKINLPRALLRGRYMSAAARMEFNGIPIDTDTLAMLRENWDNIKDQLIAEVDKYYGVYVGQSLRQKPFERWLAKHKIPWPRTPTGRLCTDQDTFSSQAKIYPSVAPLAELNYSLGSLKLEKLAVGSDGRNRTMLSPFSSKTGRNQPSNNKYIFGPAVWLRSLIQPETGTSIAYIDWSQQELGIAAALSQDPKLLHSYTSGDPYIGLAIQSGAVPPTATKQSHPVERAQFKQCSLAVQYGQGAYGLADRLGQPVAQARNLLVLHRETYRQFWKWLDHEMAKATYRGVALTVFGWRMLVSDDINPRSLMNYSMQANGAEMMRLAAILATERGVKVIAPVHDAFMVEADTRRIHQAVAVMRSCMAEASRIVLAGFELDTEFEIVDSPNRYIDPRGESMWNQVLRLCQNTKPNLGVNGK